MVSVTPRPFFTPGKDSVPFVQEAGWDPGLVWIGAENLAPTGIRSPDRPALSQSLYPNIYLHISIFHKSLNGMHRKRIVSAPAGNSVCKRKDVTDRKTTADTQLGIG